MRTRALGILLASTALAASPALADTIFVIEREGQHRSRCSTATRSRSSTPSRGCSARAASPPRPTASTSTSAPRTTTSCGSTTARPTRSCRACPRGRTRSSSCCIRRGNPLYIANEDDNIVTVVDVDDAAGARRDAGRRRARGHGGQPRRQDRGQHLRDHQHGAPDRHLDATRSSRTCSSTRGRASPSTRRDGKLLFVSAEIGGTVSVIDPAKQRGRPQDHLRGAGRAARGAAAGRHPGDGGRLEGLRRARAGEPGGGGRRRDLGGDGLPARRPAGLAARLLAGRARSSTRPTATPTTSR